MASAAQPAQPAQPCATAASLCEQQAAAEDRGQAVDHEVRSSEEEDCEPVAKRQKKCVTRSEYVGVSWQKQNRKWKAQISHDGKTQHLGYFDDEHEAARAVDTAARRLRGEDAHGGRGGSNWLRLNFPSKREAGRAKALGMPAAR